MTILLLWLQPSKSPHTSMLFNLNTPYIISRSCLYAVLDFSVFIRILCPIIFLGIFNHIIFFIVPCYVAFVIIV